MITQSELKSRLSYSPETGEFRYVTTSSKKMKVGDVAGGILKSGHVTINIEGKRYLAHRLAWLYMTGEFPSCLIDHANRDSGDNRWSNLRLADHSNNAWNNKRISRGASRTTNGNWLSRIVIRGLTICLGTFPSKEEAVAHYEEFAELAHGEFYSKV